jgi:hypothetical protein
MCSLRWYHLTCHTTQQGLTHSTASFTETVRCTFQDTVPITKYIHTKVPSVVTRSTCCFGRQEISSSAARIMKYQKSKRLRIVRRYNWSSLPPKTGTSRHERSAVCSCVLVLQNHILLAAQEKLDTLCSTCCVGEYTCPVLPIDQERIGCDRLDARWSRRLTVPAVRVSKQTRMCGR